MDKNIDELIKQTQWFIDLDPTEVEFISTKKVRQPGGGFKNIADVHREPERVKVIWPGGITSGVFTNFDGQAIQYDMIVVAMPDSNIEIGDYWLSNNVKYVVEGMAPDNFYEKKLAIKVYGAGPIGG